MLYRLWDECVGVWVHEGGDKAGCGWDSSNVQGQRVRASGGGRTFSHLLFGGTERQVRQGLPHHPDVGLRGLGPHARPLQLFCVGRVKGGCTLCGRVCLESPVCVSDGERKK